MSENHILLHIGRIHLPHLQIRKYFMDDSSVILKTSFFIIFFQNLARNEEKPCNGKLQMSRLVKYLWIRK